MALSCAPSLLATPPCSAPALLTSGVQVYRQCRPLPPLGRQGTRGSAQCFSSWGGPTDKIVFGVVSITAPRPATLSMTPYCVRALRLFHGCSMPRLTRETAQQINFGFRSKGNGDPTVKESHLGSVTLLQESVQRDEHAHLRTGNTRHGHCRTTTQHLWEVWEAPFTNTAGQKPHIGSVTILSRGGCWRQVSHATGVTCG